QAFTDSQRHILSDYATIVAPSLDIIEQLGGGGARCMVGEIFSPRR
ncbi:arginine deiminase-related protein, partial [Staphylococcus haemolyticus]